MGGRGGGREAERGGVVGGEGEGSLHFSASAVPRGLDKKRRKKNPLRVAGLIATDWLSPREAQKTLPPPEGDPTPAFRVLPVPVSRQSRRGRW